MDRRDIRGWRAALAGAALLAACQGGPFGDGDAGAPDAGLRRPTDEPLADGGAADMDGALPDAAFDGGPPDAAPDGAFPDAAADGAAPDGAPDAGGGDAAPPPACDLGRPGPADRDRIVLVGFPFGRAPGEDGTEIGVLTLEADGTLRDDGVRLDVGVRPRRIAFAPSGELALVLGEEGGLVSVRVDADGRLALADAIDLPPASYGDLDFAPDGFTVYVVGTNSTPDGGISTVLLGCDGALVPVPEAFYPLRLAESLDLLPGGERALVRGGQALFEPVDHDDVRLLQRTAGGWSEVTAADVFVDFVDSAAIDVSPDGRTALIPNSALFSEETAQVAVVDIDGDAVAERRRLRDLPDAREARFSPDGATALVTLAEPGVVVVLAAVDGELAEVDRIEGVGLADQMAVVERGPLSGLVLLPSVDPDAGPNIARLRFEGPGRVADLGQLDLGDGSTRIPVGIAVQP